MNNQRNGLVQEILKLQSKRTELRYQERSIKKQENLLSQLPTIAQNDLGSNLSKVLPSHLVPTNVGSIKHTLIPYWYETVFELGTDPTYGPSYRRKESFQVTQESAFLLTSISRSYNSGSGSGFGAPLQITLRDNQSTRQFNDLNIPLQALGYKSNPTSLDIPLLLQPNASVSVELSSWLDVDKQYIGDGYQEIAFGGYRVPIEDVKYIMDNILG